MPSWQASLNASLRCPLEPDADRRAELALAGLLAALVVLALVVSGLTWPVAVLAAALALWALVRDLSAARPQALCRHPDGALTLDLEGGPQGLTCSGYRRYGPWWLLDYVDAQGRSRVARLLPSRLDGERQRELGRLLAGARPAEPSSV